MVERSSASRTTGDQLPTVATVLKAALADRPDAVALVARSGSLTYAKLDRKADAAASALWAFGVRPGDRVVACLPNDLDVVIAFHATQRIGAIWAGIGENLTAREQQSMVEICRPKIMLSGPAGKVAGSYVVDLPRWQSMVSAGDRPPRVAIDPHAPAGIAFSSGTTGAAKAIVHSQRNMILPAAVLVATRKWGPDLRKGDSLPFTILNLQILSTLVTAQAQGTSIIMDRRDPDGVGEWIAKERITLWNGAPAQFHDLANRPDLDLSSLREVWTGGADCPEHIRSAFQRVHGASIVATYGLSEAPTVVAIDPIDGQHHTGSSGQVLPHLDVAAYDRTGRRLPPGTDGQLGIRAAATGAWAGAWNPFLGHWESGALRPADPQQLLTGDIGHVDETGWLTMIDREKLMIVRGGANVSPAEVERTLLEHPLLDEVAVFGLPDERLGERVAALVVADDHLDEAGLLAFCSERLARYKIPQVWARIDHLPRNGMGKIIRPELPRLLSESRPL